MKNLFFILISVLITIPVFSQSGVSVRRLEVYNETKCDQRFVVYGGDECPCGDGVNLPYHSGFITIAPMSSLILDSYELSLPTTGFGATTYTGAPHEFISGVRVLDYNPFESSCEPGTAGYGCTVSQIYCGAPTPYTVCSLPLGAIDLDCKFCSWTTVTWYPDVCGGTARLTFTP